MSDEDLIAAMHCLGEDLTEMASELADRRGMESFASEMIVARDTLAKAYAKVVCRELT